jgi:molecular chaperone HscA
VLGERLGAITMRTEALDAATHEWAGRRMDRAVARAIAGKQVEDVEKDVARAEGVDAHVEAHAKMVRPG